MLHVVLAESVRATGRGPNAHDGSHILPLLVLGNLHKAASFPHMQIQGIEIEWILADGWTRSDWGFVLIHER